MCKTPNYLVWDGRRSLQLGKVGREAFKDKLVFIGHRPYDEMLKVQSPWIQVPCGQCLECRVQSSRAWADRCVLHAKQYEHNYFVTLTYDDAFYPKNGSLSKRDYQLFMKRLRKKFPDVKISYLLSGEYGDKTMRPHYHMILFNCPLDDLSTRFKILDPKTKRLVTRDKPGKGEHPLFYSHTIHDAWHYKGMISVGKFNYDTAAYISQYVTKKVNPKNAVMYKQLGIEPEFLAMSQGIAKQWMEEKDDLLYSFDKIVIAEGGDTHLAAIPRYFDKKFKEKYGEDVFDPIRYHRLSKKLENQETYKHGTTHFDRDCLARDYRLHKQQKLKTQI